MSIKINNEAILKEKITSINLVSIIEKYYLPKDSSFPETKQSKTQNLDMNLSNYLSLLSSSHNNTNNNIP